MAIAANMRLLRLGCHSPRVEPEPTHDRHNCRRCAVLVTYNMVVNRKMAKGGRGSGSGQDSRVPEVKRAFVLYRVSCQVVVI